MHIKCIHVRCSTEVQYIVSSSTNPGVLFASCDLHVDEAREFVGERFMGRVYVSTFSRIRKVPGSSSVQAA